MQIYAGSSALLSRVQSPLLINGQLKEAQQLHSALRARDLRVSAVSDAVSARQAATDNSAHTTAAANELQSLGGAVGATLANGDTASSGTARLLRTISEVRKQLTETQQLTDDLGAAASQLPAAALAALLQEIQALNGLGAISSDQLQELLQLRESTRLEALEGCESSAQLQSVLQLYGQACDDMRTSFIAKAEGANR